MKRIQEQSPFTVNAYDFRLVYFSDGRAIIVCELLNNEQLIKTEEIQLTKEETDLWNNDDSLIIQKISESFPTLNLSEQTL